MVEAALNDVGIGAHVNAMFAVGPGVESGDQNHRQLSKLLVGANFGCKAKAIHARHIHVGNHHMELGAPQPGEGINSVHGGLDLITRGFEDVLKQAA